GPAFEPDAVLAFPQAQIAVMGPEAAVNAVLANKIEQLPEDERQTYVKEKQDAYREEIDIYKLASEMVVDDIIDPNQLREELKSRYEVYADKNVTFTDRKHGVY